MANYVAYTPVGVIAQALFNFDIYDEQNYRLSGTVTLSVSDSFTLAQYLADPQPLDFDIFTDLNSGTGNWDAEKLGNIALIAATFSNFANIQFTAVENRSGLTPSAVGNSSDINISLIYRTDLDFSGESAGSDDIAFGYVGASGDIVINLDGLGGFGRFNDASLDSGSFGFHVLMHEIGHSLGLAHPHSDYIDGVAVITQDYAATTGVGFDKLGFRSATPADMNREYFSIMSYDDQTPPGDFDTFAQTPMILDVIALQTAYGEGAGSTTTGDDVITPGGGGGVSSFRTYFDTGGTDSVDLENYAEGAYLHLGTTILGAAHLVGVAMSATDAHTTLDLGGDPASLRWFFGEFENATGSAGNDSIVDNALNNYIDGGAGNDVLDCSSGGADSLSGGTGRDTLSGGAGDDLFLFAASGNDTDQIVDFSIGDAIRIGGAALVSAISVGNGSRLGLNQVQVVSSGGNTTVYVGTDAVGGADVAIQVNGEHLVGDFALVGDRIGLAAANTRPSGRLGVSGTPDPGQTLTAMPTLEDADGLGTLGYQWQMDGRAIDGATLAGFTVGLAQGGRALSLVATYLDGHGVTESIGSAALPVPFEPRQVDFLAYSWKAHTLLDATNIVAPRLAATTDGVGASRNTVDVGTLWFDAGRAVAAAEATATASSVNVQDAIDILKMVVGLGINGTGNALSPYQALAADFDGNGVVNVNDAIGVLKHVVGLAAPDPTWHFLNEADLSAPAKAGLNPGPALGSMEADITAASPVHVGLVGYLSGDVDGSFAGASGSADLDLAQPDYFTALLTSHPELSLAQFGIYPV